MQPKQKLNNVCVLFFNKRTFRVCSGPSAKIICFFFLCPCTTTTPNPHTLIQPLLLSRKVPEKRPWGVRWRSVCRGCDRDSRGQAVQGIQGEEDVRLALKGACSVPQQLATLQVWRDVLHADGLIWEVYGEIIYK